MLANSGQTVKSLSMEISKMALLYVPKPNATVKDWLGWYVDERTDDLSNKRAGLTVTAVSGDVVNMSLSDSGKEGGPTGNPTVLTLPVPPLKIDLNVDLNRFKVPIESLTVLNTVTLDPDVTLTLLVLAPGQNAGQAQPKKIQYHRKLLNSLYFSVTIDLFPTISPTAPR
jgi:hypothetical protein